VSASRIQMISKGRRVALPGEPDFRSVEHPWAGFPFEEAQNSTVPIPSHCWRRTTLCVCTRGQGVTHWKHRGIWHQHHVQRGSVFMVRGNAEIDAVWSENSWRFMLLQLDTSKIEHLALDEVTAIEKSLSSAQTTEDEQLTALMLAMGQEVRDGCASGRLYGESISLALLAYLASNYASPRHTGDSGTRLSPVQRRKLVDYIQANLTSNISVTELAGLVQMSPSHFARTFKASFGVAPYRFVMRERIEGAKYMLTSTKHSASQVAIAFGFASQSHFVKVFRQFTGVTPKQYKAGL